MNPILESLYNLKEVLKAPNLSKSDSNSISELYAACSRSVLPKPKTRKDFLWVGDLCRAEGDSMLEHGNL